MKRWWIACLCILALGCGGGMSTSAPPAAQKPLPPIATATVDPAGAAIPVSPSFLGLSHEWGEAQDMMGQAPAPLNPAYVQLLRNLDAYGNGPLVLRIGGNSTDRTGEPTPGVVDPFAAVRGATGAEFILGLNFGADDPQLTADQAAAYRAAMPAGSVIAWELGNEPDLYRVNGDRPANYYLPAYIQDFDTWKAKLVPSVLPGPNPFAAPSWAGLSHLVSLQAFLDAEAPSLAMVTQHHYPYSVCGGKTPPTPEMLLSEATIQLAVPSLATYVPEATAVGVPFRLDEVNSVSCLGAYGVSDTFASALWCTDFMCECARLGLSGINIHSHSSGAYSVFTFATSGSGASTTYAATVRPLYYGMLLFAQAAAQGGSLVPTTVSSTANIKVWAFQDRDRVLRVLVLNKDTVSGSVAITLSAARGPARVTRLTASGPAATQGLRLGGLTFDGALNGVPRGTPAAQTLWPAKATYTVTVSGPSAALLTIQP